MILNQSEFYLPAAVTKRAQCTQQDVQTNVGNGFPNAPSRSRRSEKNYQVAEKRGYLGEIELENEGNNEHLRFT